MNSFLPSLLMDFRGILILSIIWQTVVHTFRRNLPTMRSTSLKEMLSNMFRIIPIFGRREKIKS